MRKLQVQVDKPGLWLSRANHTNQQIPLTGNQCTEWAFKHTCGVCCETRTADVEDLESETNLIIEYIPSTKCTRLS